jgi:hypothetical protein
MSISQHAESLCNSKRDRELLNFAEENWPGDVGDLGSEHAELARFTRIAAYRSEDPTRDLWQARHVTAAVLSGNLRSLALALQPYMFTLVAGGRPNEARQVLDLMIAVAEANTFDAPPDGNLVERIITERRAFTYTSEQRWGDARTWYDRASTLTVPGSRGAAKIAGDVAVMRWLDGGSAAEAAKAFAALAQIEWADLRDVALANLAAARQDDRARAVLFDLV